MARRALDNRAQSRLTLLGCWSFGLASQEAQIGSICYGAVGVVRKVNGASACQLADHLMVDYASNELMRPVYDVARRTLATASLRPDLQEVRDAGLISHSGRVYLRYYARKRQQAAAAMDQFAAERWVNDVHIESSLSASDASWRVDVLVQALLFASGVIAGFAVLAQHTAQAVIGLQGAPGTAGPDIDYPVGSVHMCQLVRPEDDARIKMGHSASPYWS